MVNGTKPLEYKLWAFTGQGFGGKLQVDFTENNEDYVTLGRFNPAGDTMCVKVGEVIVPSMQRLTAVLIIILKWMTQESICIIWQALAIIRYWCLATIEKF